MNPTIAPLPIAPEESRALYEKLKHEAAEAGYNLNPDTETTLDLMQGLLTNEKRYGYRNCPCRLASGTMEQDLDIICPCDYRDADIAEFGLCYCALYVNEDIAAGKTQPKTIPERRRKRNSPSSHNTSDSAATIKTPTPAAALAPLSQPVWRCKVCGYLCGREAPPEKCPICKAGKERFERFI